MKTIENKDELVAIVLVFYKWITGGKREKVEHNVTMGGQKIDVIVNGHSLSITGTPSEWVPTKTAVQCLYLEKERLSKNKMMELVNPLNKLKEKGEINSITLVTNKDTPTEVTELAEIHNVKLVTSRDIFIRYAGGDSEAPKLWWDRTPELNRTTEAYRLTSLGHTYEEKGELDIALDYYNSSLAYVENENQIKISFILTDISRIFLLKGDPKQALIVINQGLKLAVKTGRKYNIIRCFLVIGVIYKLLGETDLAIQYLENGRELIKSTQDAYPLLDAEILLQLILVWQDRAQTHPQAYTQAMRYVGFTARYSDLKHMDQGLNKKVRLIYDFAKATIQKMHRLGRKKLQAVEAFQKIVYDATAQVLSHELTILAMINLFELLLLEVKISDSEEELLQEMTQLSGKLSEIAYHQSSIKLTITTFVLGSKLRLIDGDLEGAIENLEQAQKIAEEKKLTNLVTKVNQEKKVVQAEIEKWTDLSRRNIPLKERLEYAKIESYLTEAKKIQEAWIRPSVELTTQFSQFTEQAKRMTDLMRDKTIPAEEGVLFPDSVLNLSEIKEATILLKKGENWGSGFLSKTIPGADFSHYWFVSAGHCVYDSSPNGYIYDKTVEWFLYTKEKEKEFTQIPTHSGTQEDKTIWRIHTGTDLAARVIHKGDFELDPYFPAQKYCLVKKLRSLRTGLKVDYFGYDDENIDSENPVPQLKHRRGDIDHIDSETKILSISGSAVGGFSGGPVFLREISYSELEGGIPYHKEKFFLIGIMIAVSRPQEKTGLPRNEIKVASVDLIDELIEK